MHFSVDLPGSHFHRYTCPGDVLHGSVVGVYLVTARHCRKSSRANSLQRILKTVLRVVRSGLVSVCACASHVLGRVTTFSLHVYDHLVIDSVLSGYYAGRYTRTRSTYSERK